MFLFRWLLKIFSYLLSDEKSENLLLGNKKSLIGNYNLSCEYFLLFLQTIF